MKVVQGHSAEDCMGHCSASCGSIPHGIAGTSTLFCHLEIVPERMTFKLVSEAHSEILRLTGFNEVYFLL